ncbi:MAG: hypothetical protein MI919_02130, partial [Holophagales bacterium]|nr:hypothetical protein [Holophagales bacterium]
REVSIEAEPGLVLRHARGYRVLTADQRLQDRARSAVILGIREDRLGLEVGVATGLDGSDVVADLELRLEPAERTTTRGAGSLTLAVAVPAPDGRLLSRVRRLPVRHIGEKRPLVLRLPLRLPAGVDEIGLALRDDATGGMSHGPVRISLIPADGP